MSFFWASEGHFTSAEQSAWPHYESVFSCLKQGRFISLTFPHLVVHRTPLWRGQVHKVYTPRQGPCLPTTRTIYSVCVLVDSLFELLFILEGKFYTIPIIGKLVLLAIMRT